MKVAAVYGNARHGSTHHTVQLVLDGIQKRTSLELMEIVLPRDLNHFCAGCFTCIYQGEQKCPHTEAVAPIVQTLTEADLIILSSPIYGLDVSGPMKTFIDHLCYMWMSHRPNPAMFDKLGLSVVTTAGAGAKHATKTLRSSLRFWGVKRIFSYRKAVSASKWSEVTAKNQEKMAREADALAGKIVKTAANIQKIRPPFFRSILFFMMKGMMRKNTWNPHDKAHWEKQGWIEAGQSK